MTIQFEEMIDLLPIPTTAPQAAWQAKLVADRIAASGGIEQAVIEGVQAILDTTANDPPTELGRLRVLYREAYTTDELASLVRNTFAALQLTQSNS